MEIYIDESGIYQPSVKPHSVSCVVALIIPEYQRTALFEAISNWKSSTYLQHKLSNQGELKGKSLNESECAAFIKLLAQFDVLAEVVCIDMGATTDEQITDEQILKHKSKWPPKKSDDTTPYDPSKLMGLSNQLYAQMHALFTLIHQVMKVAIHYYAQRTPQELSNFEWIIDAKATSITTYEDLFAWMIKPVLQSVSKHEPMGFVEGFDYSAFDKYLIEADKEPENKLFKNQLSGFINISALMEKIKFTQSHHDIGLQAVDVIVNCVRRAMVGNLQFDGWKYLEKLVIRRNYQAITVQKFGDDVSIYGSAPYGGFVKHFQKYGKQMLVS